MNPLEMLSPTARRAAELARAKSERSADANDKSFRATCPWCHAPTIVMSPINQNLPACEPPLVGDTIACEACGGFHVIERVDDKRFCHTFPLALDLGAS